MSDEILKLENLRFDAEKHEYWIGPIRYPSVTEIISGVGLSRDYSNVPAETLEHAGKRGRHIHSYVEHLIEDKPRPVWAMHDPQVKELEQFAEDWVDRWERDENKVLIACEDRLFHPVWGYAGTVDLAFHHMTEDTELQLWVVDIKVRSAPPDEGDTYQLAAYAGALIHHKIAATDSWDRVYGCILDLRRNKLVSMGRLDHAWRVFRSAAVVYNEKIRRRLV